MKYEDVAKHIESHGMPLVGAAIFISLTIVNNN